MSSPGQHLVNTIPAATTFAMAGFDFNHVATGAVAVCAVVWYLLQIYDWIEHKRAIHKQIKESATRVAVALQAERHDTPSAS